MQLYNVMITLSKTLSSGRAKSVIVQCSSVALQQYFSKDLELQAVLEEQQCRL